MNMGGVEIGTTLNFFLICLLVYCKLLIFAVNSKKQAL